MDVNLDNLYSVFRKNVAMSTESEWIYAGPSQPCFIVYSMWGIVLLKTVTF